MGQSLLEELLLKVKEDLNTARQRGGVGTKEKVGGVMTRKIKENYKNTARRRGGVDTSRGKPGGASSGGAKERPNKSRPGFPHFHFLTLNSLSHFDSCTFTFTGVRRSVQINLDQVFLTFTFSL